MAKKRTVRRIALAGIALYILSYLVMSLSGRYEPGYWGVAPAPNQSHPNEIIFIPKRGYDWHPFALYSRKGYPTFLGIIYFPLIHMDRVIWHRKSLAESDKYKVQRYPDVAN